MTFRYDEHVTLLIVDVQNDFAEPTGSLSVAGATEIVAVANAEAAAARSAGAFVAFTQDWHPPDTPHFAKDGGTWPVHCVRDTWGARLVDGLEVGDAPVVRKGIEGEDGYSGFSVRDAKTGAQASTQLEQLLREHHTERVVIVGLATDYCVKETALDAVRLGFATTVLREGIRAVDVNDGDGDRALAEMTAAGVQVS